MAKNSSRREKQESLRRSAALWAGFDSAVAYYRPRMIRALANSALKISSQKEG